MTNYLASNKTKKIIVSIFLIAIIAIVFVVFKASKIFYIIHLSKKTAFPKTYASEAVDDPLRTDILLLGIRGENDQNGGMLTDTIMLVSYKKETKELALISIPRDIYLKNYPGISKEEKINAVYLLGEEQKIGYGLEYAKTVISEIIGIKIDYGALINFSAFKELIDELGGIDVLVSKPLRENLQWGGIDFYVPAGRQYMNGEKALYYVRSRFTTDDFDRAKRQQEVFMAIKEKALNLGILVNPFKINKIFNIIGNNVKTDLNFMEIVDLLSSFSSIPPPNIKHKVLGNGKDGLLYSAYINNSYVLLPKSGNFDQIKEIAKNIFKN